MKQGRTRRDDAGAGAANSPCQLRLRFVKAGEIALGPGKVELLEAVEAEGSISGAARQLGMSYRRAWLLVRTMNQCFPGALVATSKGGERRGGAQLTPLGREVVGRYRAIEATLRKAAADDIGYLEALLEEGGE